MIFSIIVSNILGTFSAYLIHKFITIEDKLNKEEINE